MVEMKHIVISELHFFFIFPGSCQMEGIVGLYNYISIYLSGILCFVSFFLAAAIFLHLDGWRHLKQFIIETNEEFIYWMRFVWNWTHSTSLELIWTIIPTFILIAIAIPSFILLYSLDEIVDCQCVVKIVGYQWYWRYEYPVNYHDDYDLLNVTVVSYMTPTPDLTGDTPNWLLEVDMPLVLPHSVNVKLIITSKDVLHSFAIPALGIKMDAVPGRLNQVTIFILQPGIYYGQCSELCGVNHAYMPIVIHAVSFETYQKFLLKIAFAQEKDNIEKAFNKLFFDENFLNELNESNTKNENIPTEPEKSECLSCWGIREDTDRMYIGGKFKEWYHEYLLARDYTKEEIQSAIDFAYAIFDDEAAFNFLNQPDELKYKHTIDTLLELKRLNTEHDLNFEGAKAERLDKFIEDEIIRLYKK